MNEVFEESKQDVNIKLEYYVPQLGKVTVKLSPCAKKCYEILEEEGYIRGMMEIDQLGVIRNVYGGAHHSRWEYVMVQLSLIELLKKSEGAKGLGLSSDVKKIYNKSPIGADVLQTWVLLFNSGHLPGTFATERAILRCCKKYEELRKTIYNGLPHENKIRRDFEKICDEENIYAFHRILTCFFLERYKNNSRNSRYIDTFQKIIRGYIEPSNQKNLKKIFRRVRQLSYIFLDSQYAPCPFSLNLSNLYINISDYVNDLFKEDNSLINRTLNSLEDLLSMDVYLSAASIRELGAHARKIEDNLEGKREELGDAKAFFDYLKSKSFPPDIIEWRDSLNLYFLLDISRYPQLLETFNENSREFERNWTKRAKNSCLLTFQPGSNQKHLAFTLSFLPESQIQKNMKIIGEFLSDTIKLNFKIKEQIKNTNSYDKEWIDNIFQRPYQELITSILKYITNQKIFVTFKNTNRQERYILPTENVKLALEEIEREIEKIDDDSRKHELETLKNALQDLSEESPHNSKGSNIILSLSRMLVSNDERELAEFDGFGFDFVEDKLKILLVEGKKQRKGSSGACKKQLERAFNDLKFKTSEDLKEKIRPIEGGAYCNITIDGNLK